MSDTPDNPMPTAERAALLDRLADLREVWATRLRETSDPLTAGAYSRIISELDATTAGHGPALTTAEQLAAVEARAERDADLAAARIADLEQQVAALTAERTP